MSIKLTRIKLTPREYTDLVKLVSDGVINNLHEKRRSPGEVLGL